MRDRLPVEGSPPSTEGGGLAAGPADEFEQLFERLNQIALEEFEQRGKLIAYVQSLRFEIGRLKAQLASSAPLSLMGMAVKTHCSRCGVAISGTVHCMTHTMGAWCSEYCRDHRDVPVS